MEEDESLCSLSGIKCPQLCVCLMFAMSCHSLKNHFLLSSNLPFHVILVDKTRLHVLRILMRSLVHFTVLKIRDNSMHSLCSIIPSTVHAISVDAGFNQIKRITSGCFKNSSTLATIKLGHNVISYIDFFAFNGLTSLAVVDLSFNKISSLPANWHDTGDLKVLLIQGNTVVLSENICVMKNVDLKYLKADEHLMCCLVNEDVQCLIGKPWFFSCTDLLPVQGMKTCFYIESAAIIALGSTSMVIRAWQLYKDKFHSWAFGCTVFSVDVVDLTCGFYLTIIWVQDIIRDEIFAVYESEWKSGFLCFLACTVLLNFNLLSPVLHCFMSVERLMVVLHPMDTIFKKAKFILRCICLLSTMTFILSLSTNLTLRLYSLHVPFKLCSPFIDLTDSVVLFKVTTWSIILL